MVRENSNKRFVFVVRQNNTAANCELCVVTLSTKQTVDLYVFFCVCLRVSAREHWETLNILHLIIAGLREMQGKLAMVDDSHKYYVGPVVASLKLNPLTGIMKAFYWDV